MATFVITFDTSGGADNGKIRLYAQDPDAGSPTGDFKVYFELVDPLGIYRNEITETPDVTFAALGNDNILIDIPIDSEGNYLGGTYTARCIITDSADPVVEFFDENVSFVYSPSITPSSTESDKLTLVASYDCATGLITATGSETNSDPGDTLSGQEISVTPEAAVGEGPSTESASEISYQFTFSNADYVVQYSGDLETLDNLTDETDFYVLERVTKSTTLTVKCEYNACALASCMEEEFKRLDALTCGKSWAVLTNIQKGKYLYASATARMSQLFYNCGNYAKAGEYMDKLRTLLDCGCDCSGSTNNQPVPYSAPGFMP